MCKLSLAFIFALLIPINGSFAANARLTNPLLSDTDRDRYIDGPDSLFLRDGQLYWCIGEDKNGNGRFEPEGADGVLGTSDDESDPEDDTDPTEKPGGPVFAPVERYDVIADRHDADYDGFSDYAEDLDLNGVKDGDLGRGGFAAPMVVRRHPEG